MTDKEYMDDVEKHKANVKKFIYRLITDLSRRAEHHDDSKFVDPEKASYIKHVPLLRETTYGSEEYKNVVRSMTPAVEHHYAANRHHPQHFEDGIAGMSLIDIVEMFCDWKAAAMRHKDGDINKSIKYQAERFKIDPQLISIFKNTVVLLEE